MSDAEKLDRLDRLEGMVTREMRPPPDSTFRTFAQKTGWPASVDVVPRKRRFR
jgi:hypothetical protein